jgi:hypothetical protein
MKRTFVLALALCASWLIGCSPVVRPAAQVGESASTIPSASDVTPAAPDLAGLDQQPWTATSPDGAWIIEGLTAIPLQGGDQYYTEMHVNQVTGDLAWTPIAGWQPFGLGYTTPRIVHWSIDSRYLYYTNAPHPDGCGLFVNASDLQRLDLTNGAVEEILPPNATWVLEAAPDGTIAYIDQTTLVFFDPNDDTRQESILDFAQPDVQLGNLVWSPDSQRLALTAASDPCIPPTWRHAIYVVNRQSAQVQLVLAPDERRFQIDHWIADTHLALTDSEGAHFVLDLVTGTVVPAASQS